MAGIAEQPFNSLRRGPVPLPFDSPEGDDRFRWRPAAIAPAAAPVTPTVIAPHLRPVSPPRELPEVLRERDPDMIRQLFPWAAFVCDKYFRAEVRGVEHLSDKASMIVATHNGAAATPDLYALFVAFLRRFGLETPAYGLAHKAVFTIPGMGPLFKRFGAIPASRANGSLVLRENCPLLICPGGDVDALKPYSERHVVKFGKRRGFIRLAIKEQVPIIPVVSVGAHETMMVLNDGEKLARILRFDKMFRVKSVPLTLSFPIGLGIASVPSVPLPSKIKVRVLPRIELGEPAAAADDPERVERCFEHVRSEMQRALTDLAFQRRRPVLG